MNKNILLAIIIFVFILCSFPTSALIPGDFDGSGRVDFDDLMLFALAYGSTTTDANWNPVCDFDPDGKIDFEDLMLFALHYGEEGEPGYRLILNAEPAEGGTAVNQTGTALYYQEGDLLSISAVAQVCHVFDYWRAEPDVVTFSDPFTRETTFLMPSQDLTITAHFLPASIYNQDTGHSYQSIQAAIYGALDGETIVVCPGIYYENLEFAGRNITLQSADPSDPDIVAATILDGGRGSVVEFSGGDTSTLKGFTIQDGDADYGGGIHIHGASSPTIDGNIITGNEALDNGAGIYVGENSSPTISKNAITSNLANGTSGGGITVDGASSPTITGNTIIGNMAMAGGGIFVFGASSPTITGNFIIGHSVQYGGAGIYVYGGSCFIDGNTITGNSAEESGGGIWVSGGASATISYNTIHYNMAQIDGGGIYVSPSSNLLPISPRTTGWGVGRENIPTTALNDPAEGIEYEIAGNTFLGNEHGSPLDYTEGAHVYFDED